MTKTIEDLFVLIATYTPLLPILAYFLLFKYTRAEKVFQLLVAYSIVELVINIVAVYELWRTIYLYPLFTIIEFPLFAFILYLLLKNATVKKLIVSSVILFLIFSITYFFTVKIKQLDTIPIGIETVLILSYCFVYFYESMQNESQEFIYHRHSFWIISGILIYLGGSCFIYLFANQIDKKTLHAFWTFQNVFSILKNILFTMSIYIFYKNANRKSIKKIYHYQY